MARVGIAFVWLDEGRLVCVDDCHDEGPPQALHQGAVGRVVSYAPSDEASKRTYRPMGWLRQDVESGDCPSPLGHACVDSVRLLKVDLRDQVPIADPVGWAPGSSVR